MQVINRMILDENNVMVGEIIRPLASDAHLCPYNPRLAWAVYWTKGINRAELAGFFWQEGKGKYKVKAPGMGLYRPNFQAAALSCWNRQNKIQNKAA